MDISPINKTRLYIAVPIMLICLLAIYYSLRLVVADTYAYKARYHLSKWEKEARLPVEAEVEGALLQASSALYWDSNNTEYMDLKAHLIMYQGLVYWGDKAFSEMTDEAVKLYRHSTEVRPKWPYAWARLALVKAYRGEFDGVFSEAVARAVKNGAWEPNVQKDIAEAGLYGWDYLSRATKRDLVANIQRGLSFQKRAMLEVVGRHDKKVEVCSHMTNNKRSREFCR